MKRNKISIVVPVYQNQGSIEQTYIKVRTVLLQMNADYEFIFVNDGSTDNSHFEIKKIQSLEISKVRYISFVKNYGQVAAMVAGFRAATGDMAVNISADLQDPPELISEMYEEWKNGFQVVIAKRISRNDGFFAGITSKGFYKLINFSNSQIPVGGFDFVLLGSTAIRLFNSIKERNRFFQGDIVNLGFPIKFLSYERKKRTIGKSQWTIGKKVKYFIDGVINTSYLPIRIMSFLGVILSVSGFLYSLILILNYFVNGGAFKGWTPILISIIIIGGVLMVMLGIIGEYLWRIYDEIRDRPLYVTKELDEIELAEKNNEVFI